MTIPQELIDAAEEDLRDTNSRLAAGHAAKRLLEDGVHLAGDLQSVAGWMRRPARDLSLVVTSEPIEQFLPQIREMEASYGEWPREARRTEAIEHLLKSGGEPKPVYVEADDPDNFIMEGRHRIVAYHRRGMTTVPVCRVSVKATLQPGPGRT